jgi:hypothetical protein
MKNTFKTISLCALGIAGFALLTSVRPTPAPAAASAPRTVTLKTISVPSAIQVAGDGQETHGDKGKTKG